MAHPSPTLLSALALAACLAFAAPGSAQPKPSPAPVTLNFVNSDIEAAARAMAAMTGKQIAVDPRVKGQLTLYTERPLPVAEAYLAFLSALRGQGFAAVEVGGIVKVVPEAEAKLQTGVVSVDGVAVKGDQILTQIFRLGHENPNNLVAVLRPLISPNNTINVSPGNNSLVITDYADNLQRLGRIIAALDQPASSDLEVLTLRHAIASDLAPVVLRLLEGAGAATVPGAPPGAGAGGTQVLADPRTNQLIVRAGTPAKLAQARAIVEKLDRPLAPAPGSTPGSAGSLGGPAGQIWVVYLRNADATRLATVLRAAFATAFSGLGGNAGAGAGGGAGLNHSAGGASTLPAAPAPQSIAGLGGGTNGTGVSAAALAPVQAAAQPSTGGYIQADPASNSLVITAPEALYRQIRAVIDQLDTRRAQVYVESLIVKVDATKAAEFGFQWQGLLGQSGDKNLIAGGTNFGAGGNNIVNLQLGAASGTLTTPPGAGLNVGLIRNLNGVYTLASLARFLESNAGANVLSTPTLVALDNEEAKIVIGQNVPFITGSFTNALGGTGSVNPFQTIERRDVGLTLRIRSQIGESGTVRMQVFQENSAVVPGSSGSAGPTTDKSSIETSVVVDDGQIIVLGGLLKDEYTDGQDRVPGLGSIPVIGNLFRSENRKRIKSNLMVFLRPVVLRNQAGADSVTLDRYEAIRAQQQRLQPLPSSLLPVEDGTVLPEKAPPAPIQPSAASAPPSTPAAPTPAAPTPVR